MVAWNQPEIKWKTGIATKQSIGEPPASIRRNGNILLPVKNGRLDVTNDIKCLGPVLFAFFHPLPGQGPISVYRVVVLGHPSGCMPVMEPFLGDGLGSLTHHIERRCNQDEFFYDGKLLRA